MEADELRTSLGWVEIAGEEDNLAIMLCTVFDDGGPEDSDTGWSEAAVAGYEKTRDAIHAHYASALAARDARIAEFERILADPNAVHINMLRGTIARPSIEQVRHLYPEEFAALEAEREKLREALAEAADELDAYYTAEYPTDHAHHVRKIEPAKAATPARAALQEPTDAPE